MTEREQQIKEYQGLPPIVRVRDNIFDKYEDIIGEALQLNVGK